MIRLLPRKSVIVLTTLAAALAWLLLREAKIQAARRALANAQREITQLQDRIANAAASQEAVSQDLREARSALDEKQRAINRAEQELAVIDPEAGWAVPPLTLQWDDSSPYVWINKKMLARLPGNRFTENAELSDEFANTLALDRPARRALSERLASILAEYRGLETAHAERIEEPLPGIARDEPQVTVRVTPFPEEGKRLRHDFEEALQTALGTERAQLITESSSGWLDSQFASASAEPKTISVVRHPDGSYNVSSKVGNSWLSTGGFKQLDEHVPPHLLPLFSELAPAEKPDQIGLKSNP